jgi:hypothetical protein
MAEGAASFPDIKQVAVGGDIRGKPITVVDAATPDAIRAGVKQIVAAAA